MIKAISRRNYMLISKMFGGKFHKFTSEVGYCVIFESANRMNLYAEVLHRDKYGNPVMSLTHYFTQNGDFVSDPDMTIRIFHNTRQAEALTYMDQFKHYEVCNDDGTANLQIVKELNIFLYFWLTQMEKQEFKIIEGDDLL